MESTDITRAPQIIIVVWSTLVLAGVLIVLKLLARARKRLRWWWDDYMMVLSWVSKLPSPVSPVGSWRKRERGRVISNRVAF